MLLGRLALIAGLSLTGAACQRRCQLPETMAFKSMVDTQWRLVSTTDPAFASKLDNFNFLIVTFNRNNTGDVKLVVDNTPYEQAAETLVWSPNPQSQMVRIQYTSGGTQVQAGDQGTFDYYYTLTNELQMYESKKGYFYRYVPYKGIVNPDTLCAF